MKKKERLQAELDKMLAEYESGHSKLKHLKEKMRKKRDEIASTPKNIIDERPDELNLKS